MSQTLATFAVVIAFLGPERCAVPFFFEGLVLYALARIQDGIDRSAA